MVQRFLALVSEFFIRSSYSVRNTRKSWEDTYLGKTARGEGWADPRVNINFCQS
jgi:hypothetical protein